MAEKPKYYTVQAAADELGISRFRVWSMIKNGELKATVNPVDRRERLISAKDVERLSAFTAGVKKAVA